MTDISIKCREVFEFIVKFSDLKNCVKEHEQNYQEYTAKLSIFHAQYITTSLNKNISIDCKHKSKTILSKEAFEKVHKAVNNKIRDQFTIKILSEEKERKMKEVNIMSKLYHISLFMLCFVSYTDLWEEEHH